MKSVDLSGNLQEILARAPFRKRVEIGCLPELPSVRFCAGQVIEVLGEHPHGWLVRLFKQNAHTRIGWISNGRMDLCPVAIAQESIPLSRFLFLESVEEKDGFNKIAAFMKSGLFQLIVFEQVFFRIKPDVNLRKLQLLAESFGVGLIMRSRWATHSFSVHIVIDTDVHFHSADFIKVKGGTDGRI